MAHGYCTVAPRYTCGSPAMVPGEIAERVAAQEKDAYAYILEGAEGEERRQRAEHLGLRGIAEYKVERGSGRKHGWDVLDLCTGERCFRLCPEALEKSGWRRYSDLQTHEQRLVDASPPTDIEDRRSAWYKLEPKTSPTGWDIQVYRPEYTARAA